MDLLLNSFVTSALKGKAESTISTYLIELQLFEKWLKTAGTDLLGYARTDVQQYMDHLKKQKKASSTMNKAWCAIKVFSRWVNKEEAIQDIRIVKPKNIKQIAPKSLTKLQRNKLLREIDRYESKRNYAIIVLLLNTGLRVNELVHLDIADITMTDRKGHMRVIGKGDKERIIPLNAETRRAITLYLETRTDPDAALFLSNYKRRISKRSVQRIIEKYGIHAHQLRHTFIRQLVKNNTDISTIKSFTGHESADMIMRYSVPSEGEKEREIENLYNDD